MCGIFGYVGENTNVGEMVLDGLKLLEYRGYDSWGIAVKQTKVIEVQKNIGKIGSAEVSFDNSTIGIGHTRWATHGGVTVKNAHPHKDCEGQIAVLHNGIIENYEEIKNNLVKRGHKFVSETDTEIIPHLIEENLKKQNFVLAFQNAFNQLTGMNAVVAMSSDSSEIVAAKSGSPLIVGRSKKGFYVSSDPSGVIKHTNEVLFIKDHEMVVLGDRIQVFSLPKGTKIKPKFEKIDWDVSQVEKGNYEHFMIKEIYEQPRVIRNIAKNYDSSLEKLSKLINNAVGTFMLGCGTASYAALAGTYLFSRIAKKHVNFSIGSEFNYLEDYLNKKSLVIPISQSGETMDIVGPVGNAKKKGAKVAAVVNVLGSTLYRLADEKILLNAGPEKAVVGTKSFIAMISVLILTAYTLANKQSVGKAILEKSANDVSNIFSQSSIKKIKNLSNELKNKKDIFVIGRGLSYATALETTLKLKETAYIHAEGFAGGELKHGVIALIEKGTPCIVIAPNDETFSEIISNAQEIKARGGFIIGIGPKNNSVFDRYLKTDDVSDATIISQVVIAQLLAYYLALSKGIKDPDKPRNLAKSVTVK